MPKEKENGDCINADNCEDCYARGYCKGERLPYLTRGFELLGEVFKEPPLAEEDEELLRAHNTAFRNFLPYRLALYTLLDAVLYAAVDKRAIQELFTRLTDTKDAIQAMSALIVTKEMDRMMKEIDDGPTA